MFKCKSSCILFTQIMLLYIVITATCFLVYNAIEYVQTKIILDGYSTIPLQNMDCLRLRCPSYKQMSDHLACCNVFGENCMLKSQCKLNLENELDGYRRQSLIWFIATGLALLVFIPTYKKLNKITKRIINQELARVVGVNIQYVRRNEQRGALNARNHEQREVSLLTESFIFDLNETCSICLVEYGEQRVVKLNCEHTFHRQCIQRWRQISISCPVCRNKQN